jgi:hypothetical protein
MKPYERSLAFIGIYALLLGAILGIIAVILLWNLPSMQQTELWAEEVSDPTYTISYYILMYAYLIPIIGFCAIHKLFSEEKISHILSFLGMIFSIIGSALPMASIGVSAFAYPAIARMIISRDLDLAILLNDILASKNMIFLLFSGFYYITGIILFGIVFWRDSNPLLKTASIFLILHGILIILPNLSIINLLSWIFLLLSSIMLIVYTQQISTS